MITEKWRTIPDFPDYVISNQGRVANKAGTLKKISARETVELHRSGYSANKRVKALLKLVW